MDISGDEKRQILVNTSEHSLAEYFTICRESKRIYVAHPVYRLIVCQESDGTTVYEYDDVDLGSTKGLYVDDDDNLLVCGEARIDITAHGKKKCNPVVQH